ncbi:hypothetical protein BH24ACT26_BH24ACT26_02650 [soil metagenome]
MVLASDLTGWWVGYSIGALIVLVVAALVVSIIATARRIAAVAEDATRSLTETRERTEVLWQVATTNLVAQDILEGAAAARRALGGGDEEEEDEATQQAQAAVAGSLPTGPERDRQLGL